MRCPRRLLEEAPPLQMNLHIENGVLHHQLVHVSMGLVPVIGQLLTTTLSESVLPDTRLMGPQGVPVILAVGHSHWSEGHIQPCRRPTAVLAVPAVSAVPASCAVCAAMCDARSAANTVTYPGNLSGARQPCTEEPGPATW